MPMARPRHPREPIAGLPPGYEKGQPPRDRRAGRTPWSTRTPTGVLDERYATRGTKSAAHRAYAETMIAIDGAVRRVASTFATNTTSPPAPRPRWLRRGRFDLVEVADVITALICFAVSNSWLATQNARGHGGHGEGAVFLAALVLSAPLVLRTRFPLTALAASGLAIIGVTVVIRPGAISSSGFVPASVLVYLLCLYAVTVRCKPRIILAAAIVSEVGAGFIEPRTSAASLFLLAIPLLLGVLVRTRRSSTRELAEQERRHSGERALLEERQRIARELHDVVAHHMSVIAIQAEAAPYKTTDPPPELVEALTDIRANALTGLTELRRVLGVLRADGADTAPQPGLADLDTLLNSARGGGVTVTATVAGTPVTLPDGVDLSAYRILQEALSNAMRHAAGSQVDIQLRYREDGLHLDVRNGKGTRAAAAQPGGGHGIVGMRERAAMLGGSLHARPTEDGGFRVIAYLPANGDPA
jgi:signal transduction histidine kinase